MNKIALRLLFLTGLAAIFCASCSKDKDLPDIPDSYLHNDTLPFSIEAVPPEGCDTLILYRIKENESIKTPFNPKDAALEFKAGDSIFLEARAESGYTFINWVCDGKGLSNDPIYGFKLEKEDIDTTNWHIKHHYEARFGLSYAIQTIPNIYDVIPPELIAVMGPHLHFGDNPPLLYKMRHDTILGFYAKGPTLLDYYAVDSTADFCSWCFVVDPITGQNGLPKERENWDYFLFHDQHRGVAQINYKCTYLDLTLNDESINISVFDEANSFDSVFIMGNKNKEFTAYFRQFRNRVISIPPNCPINVPLNYPNPGSHEAMILSGKITDNGVEDVYFGIQFLSFDDPADAGVSFSNVGDIIVFHYNYIPFAYWNPNN